MIHRNLNNNKAHVSLVSVKWLCLSQSERLMDGQYNVLSIIGWKLQKKSAFFIDKNDKTKCLNIVWTEAVMVKHLLSLARIVIKWFYSRSIVFEISPWYAGMHDFEFA